MVRPLLPRRISSMRYSTPDVSKRDGVCLSLGVVIGVILVSLLGTTTTTGRSTTTRDLQDQPPYQQHPQQLHSRTGRTMRMTTECPEATTPKTTTTTTTVLPVGMNPIYVYFGKMDLLTDAIPSKWWLETLPTHQDRHGEWFAQHGQDVAVAKFHNFKRNGYFVDLAANDAVWASNTFSLEQNFGWNGICIEANHYYWFRLGFRKCQVVGAIVGGKDGDSVQVTLGQGKAHGPYGGIVGDEFDNKQPKNKANPRILLSDEPGGPEKRYTLSLETILKTFNAPKVIDYLSLDVEGAESFILTDFPFEQYTFNTMTIERPKDDLRALFAKHGYQHVLDFRRGDTLWAHQSVYNIGKPLTEINQEDIDTHKIGGNIPGLVSTT